MLEALGRFTLAWLGRFGDAGSFLCAMLWRRPRFQRTLPLLVAQLYTVRGVFCAVHCVGCGV